VRVLDVEGSVPTYQYACTTCGHRLEVVQRFTDDPLTGCPECQGRLRKVFSPVGVVFKGSGFYRTDSRAAAANGAKKPAAESTGSAGDSGATSGEGAKSGEASAPSSSGRRSSNRASSDRASGHKAAAKPAAAKESAA
jgi:putative FmdB family regulatory protein